MEEHIGHSNFGDLHAVICWQDQWYCLPFMVLEELLKEMIRDRKEGRQSLGHFLNTWKTTWNPQPIDELKGAVETEMHAMEAYLLYT